MFEDPYWSNKTSLRLASTNTFLGITECQMRSSIQAIGYDLSKVSGYDPRIVVSKGGWPIIKHFLLRMMSMAEYKHLENKLFETGWKLTNAQMKALNHASEGWDF